MLTFINAIHIKSSPKTKLLLLPGKKLALIYDTVQLNGSIGEKWGKSAARDKIGVFGHSMGGAASVWLGRERDDVNAVVNIDASLFSKLVPLLNIYSDDAWVQLDNSSAYTANQATNINSKEAYTVHFQGSKHLSLTDFLSLQICCKAEKRTLMNITVLKLKMNLFLDFLTMH